MKGQKYSYSCIDEEELEVIRGEASIRAAHVTGVTVLHVSKIYEAMVKRAIDDESGLVMMSQTSDCGKYELYSAMFPDTSSLGHSRVKFQFRVLVGEGEWEDK